jgi:site-specific DNA-methyltransferase (adenine-specific)
MERTDNYVLGVGTQTEPTGRWPANVTHDGSDDVLEHFPESKSGANPSRRGGLGYGGADWQAECEAPRGAESGSAARFFYSPKADAEDRNEGLPRDMRNTHPTVKPVDLMRWLVRLITPPGGLVLDPFMGSGSTGKAALLDGFDFVGVDLDPKHVAIAEARLRNAGGLFVEIEVG